MDVPETPVAPEGLPSVSKATELQDLPRVVIIPSAEKISERMETD